MSSNLSKSAMFVFQDPIGKRQQLLEISGNTTVLDVKRTLSNKYGCSPSDVKIVVAGKPVKDEDNGSIFQEHTKKHGKGLACVHFCISKDNTTLCKKTSSNRSDGSVSPTPSSQKRFAPSTPPLSAAKRQLEDEDLAFELQLQELGQQSEKTINRSPSSTPVPSYNIPNNNLEHFIFQSAPVKSKLLEVEKDEDLAFKLQLQELGQQSERTINRSPSSTPVPSHNIPNNNLEHFILQNAHGKSKLLEVEKDATVRQVKQQLADSLGGDYQPSDINIVVAGKQVEGNESKFQEHTKEYGRGLTCVHFYISKDNTTSLCQKTSSNRSDGSVSPTPSSQKQFAPSAPPLSAAERQLEDENLAFELQLQELGQQSEKTINRSPSSTPVPSYNIPNNNLEHFIFQSAPVKSKLLEVEKDEDLAFKLQLQELEQQSEKTINRSPSSTPVPSHNIPNNNLEHFILQNAHGKSKLLEVEKDATVHQVKQQLADSLGGNYQPSDINIVVAGNQVEGNESKFQEHTKKYGRGLAAIHFCVSKNNDVKPEPKSEPKQSAPHHAAQFILELIDRLIQELSLTFSQKLPSKISAHCGFFAAQSPSGKGTESREEIEERLFPL